MTQHYKILKESADYSALINTLHANAFGPGRFAKAAFRLREQGNHDSHASFMAVSEDGALLGACWMTPITLGNARGFLLGPLAVQPDQMNQGIGRALMKAVMDNAKDHCPEADFVALVGDAPYYAPFGFEQAAQTSIKMPGPVAPHRMLIAPLRGQKASEFSGTIRHSDLGS